MRILTTLHYCMFSVEAVELKVQLERMRLMFELHTRLEGEFE